MNTTTLWGADLAQGAGNAFLRTFGAECLANGLHAYIASREDGFPTLVIECDRGSVCVTRLCGRFDIGMDGEPILAETIHDNVARFLARSLLAGEVGL